MLYDEAVSKFLFYLEITNKSKKTKKGYQSDLKSFGFFLCSKFNCAFYIEDISVDAIEEFVLHMKQRKLSDACMARTLYALRSFFKFLVKKKITQINIANDVEIPKQQRKERAYLVKNQGYELINAIDHPIVKYLTLTLLHTGLRISEALGLTDKDVDMGSKIIKVIAGKGNKDRVIPISPKLYDYLKEYIATVKNLDSNKFFATPSSGGLSAVYVNYHIKKAAKKIGLTEHITAHTFRHTFATKVLAEDKDLVNVKELLGHTSLSTTGIYLHTDFERLAKAVSTV